MDLRNCSTKMVHHTAHNIRAPRCQQGFALALGLIFLIVVTLLAISALSTTAVQEQMAGNIQEQFRAFQRAESGLLAGRMNEVENFDFKPIDHHDENFILPGSTIDGDGATWNAVLTKRYMGDVSSVRQQDTGSDMSFTNYEIASRATAAAGARAALFQGFRSILPQDKKILNEGIIPFGD